MVKKKFLLRSSLSRSGQQSSGVIINRQENCGVVLKTKSKYVTVFYQAEFLESYELCFWPF